LLMTTDSFRVNPILAERKIPVNPIRLFPL
jgi:hypothetical protein